MAFVKELPSIHMPKEFVTELGLSYEKEPLKIEIDLLKNIPKEYWQYLNHLFVDHGRAICTARKPNCENCIILKYCEKN